MRLLFDTFAKALPETEHRRIAKEGDRPFAAADAFDLRGNAAVTERGTRQHPRRAQGMARRGSAHGEQRRRRGHGMVQCGKIARDQRGLQRRAQFGRSVMFDPVFQRRAGGVLKFQEAGIIIAVLPAACGLHRMVKQIVRSHGRGAQSGAQIAIRSCFVLAPRHETLPSLLQTSSFAGLTCTPSAVSKLGTIPSRIIVPDQMEGSN